MNTPNASNSRQSLIEKTTALAFIAALSLACLKVAQPFIASIIGGTVLSVSLWPQYLQLSGFLGGRRILAATLITVLTATVFVFPIGVGASRLFESVPILEQRANDLSWLKPSDPPGWVGKVPLVGGKLTNYWREGLENTKIDPEKVRPLVLQALKWVLAQGADFALAMAQIIFATVIAGFFYVNGEAASQTLKKLAVRIGGEHSAAVIDVAGRTIRGVSLGVIGTAFIQALLSGFGFAIAGIPYFTLLAVLCFLFAMLQIGTGLVWIPAAIWLGYNDHQYWSAFTVAWGIFINVIDSFIRPYFISKGSKMPLLVIFTGVIGGLLAWGFMGMFVGATLLAVAYTLFWDWLDQEQTSSTGEIIS